MVLQAVLAYIVGMKTMQYTIRGVSPAVDEAARDLARRSRQSLNATLLDALRRGLGLEDKPVDLHDLDDLAGTWAEDPEFDRAMELFESVDEDLWR